MLARALNVVSLVCEFIRASLGILGRQAVDVKNAVAGHGEEGYEGNEDHDPVGQPRGPRSSRARFGPPLFSFIGERDGEEEQGRDHGCQP